MTADTQRLLLPHHVALIKASSITDKVRGERGYWSAMTTADLLPLGFRGQQAQLAPALVEPTYNVRGEQVGCDIRPDHPRLSDEGKPRKYEVPARSTVVIDVPPGARVKLADPAEALWVTEGHRKGDALVSQGLCGIDLAGVWNWRGRSTIGGRTALPCWESIHTKGRVVYICFDSDVMTKAEVHKSLVRLKAFLESRGARVLVIYLPPAGDGSKTGVDDFFFAGHSVEDLIALASRELYQPENLGKPRGQDALIKLGQELLHNVVRAEGGGPAYAIFKSGEVWPVRSSTFKSRLVLGHFQNTGFAPEKEGIEQVLTLTEAESTKAGHAVPVGVRVMGTDERIFVDLADEHGTIITITPERWDVGSGPSLVEQGAIFRRPRGMLSLPVPAPGGSIDDLREFVNLADEQWPLFIADLTSMFRPSGSYPIREINGEPGATKSTLSKVIKLLSDPNVAPLRSLPSSERDLAIAAGNSWLLAFDNVWHLEAALSDAFCRLSTGGGLGTRKLHTDDDEQIFGGARPIMLNGVPEIGTKSDFVDRVIRYTLRAIPDKERRTEREFWAAFEEAQPKILGALFDIVRCALSWLPQVKPEKSSRMADFVCWGLAVEEAMAWPAGTFLAAYEKNREAAHADAVEDSAIMKYITLVVGNAVWTGSWKKLLDEITLRADPLTVKSKMWPQTTRKLSGDVRLLAVSMRKLGWTIVFPEDQTREGGTGQRVVTLAAPGVSLPS